MVKITDENYESVVKSDKLVIIDFYADWCVPCKTLALTLEKISEDNTDITIGKADVDEAIDASKLYGIRNVPTLLFIKNGEILSKKTGSIPQSAIQAEIDKFI